ncbi:hypothetical protein EDD11_006157 [Mortierella claussenii]|nr:hypothetical protein EDD11_006157 [Mortierella claussenii]
MRSDNGQTASPLRFDNIITPAPIPAPVTGSAPALASIAGSAPASLPYSSQHYIPHSTSYKELDRMEDDMQYFAGLSSRPATKHQDEEPAEAEANSPIEEVRVTVSTYDDPSMPYNTFRMWFLGLVFTGIVSFVNQFFYLRQTQISVGYPIVALLSLPLGHFLAKVLPTRPLSIPLLPWWSLKLTLNPGPFSIKEHVLIGTMAACNTSTAYAVDIVILQKIFYHDEKPFVAGLLLVLTTQITGFELAGAVRRFLVRPAHMVWPQTLVAASLFRSLHAPPPIHQDQAAMDEMAESNTDSSHGYEVKGYAEADSERYEEKTSMEGSTTGHMPGTTSQRMSRMKYFLLVTLASFLYYWVPGFLFPTIGTLSWLCWIQPNNIPLAQLTGSNGLGIGTIALDWTAVSYDISPLVTPWFAQVNILVGFVAMVYIAAPLAYYNNLWGARRFPMVTTNLFQEDGSIYDVQAVLDPKTGYFDEQLYISYGPLRMSSFLALAYGIGFAALSATVVHTILYHGKELLQRWKSTIQDPQSNDIHSRLMYAYPEVPNWWYGSLFIVMATLSFVTCMVFDLMPWWALILALLMAMVLILPVGIVQATTNQQPGLNIVTEYVIGTLLPGHAIANVTFKTYGYIVNVQALTFLQDLKLGHYMKIPPQTMFLVQLVSSLLACVINLGTATWLMKTRPDLCTPQGYPFTCRSTRTFYSASVIWGALGPVRVFGSLSAAVTAITGRDDSSASPLTPYSSVQFGFLIGGLLPILFWILSKKLFPKTQWLQWVHWPVLLSSVSMIPPALPYFYSNGLLVGFVFMFLLRRYRFRWWSRYNYLTNAALDTGVALSALVIYFAVQQGTGLKMPYWWGNPDLTATPNAEGPSTAAIDHCYNAQLSF